MQSKTIDQFCRDHNLARATVYREINAGRLLTFLVGSTRRISDAAEADWIASCQKQTQNADQKRRAKSAASR